MHIIYIYCWGKNKQRFYSSHLQLLKAGHLGKYVRRELRNFVFSKIPVIKKYESVLPTVNFEGALATNEIKTNAQFTFLFINMLGNTYECTSVLCTVRVLVRGVLITTNMV